MDPIIVQNIKETLQRLTEEKNIKMLFAIESGSRGWGFPSTDSDYDCRFVYVKPVEAYLKLEVGADHIDLPVDEIYDVGGWDLKKFLIHIRKSNPIVWEWLQSPLDYEEEEGVRAACLKLGDMYFDEKASLYHYRSLARKKLDEISSQKEAKLKHYFYALRSTLCCHYMRLHHCIPPMELGKLMEGVVLEEHVQKEIKALWGVKLQVDEKYTIPEDKVLITYMFNELSKCEAHMETLKKKKSLTNDPLDQYFRDWALKGEDR